MPLIDLKTDLRSLKYGHDRPGGGSSDQPYIKTNINDPDSSVARDFDDGFIRGGAIGAAKASVVDTLRIGKFLTDLPKGPLFIARQTALQFSNPKLEIKRINTGIGFIDTIGNFVQDQLGLGPTRIYNLGINTIAQIPVNAFGIHFNRHGLLPVQDDSTKYLSVVQSKNNNNSKDNRLVGLTKKLIKPLISDAPSTFLTNALSLLPGASLFLTPREQLIDSYIGGPGSVYGVGKTLIKRYDYTVDGVRINEALDKRIGGQAHNKNDNNISALDRTKDLAVNGSTDQLIASADLTKDTSLPALPSAKTYLKIKTSINDQIKNYSGSLDVSVNRGAKDFKYFGTKKVFDSGSVAIYNNTLEFERYDPDIMTISFQAVSSKDINPDTGERWRFSAYMKGFKDNYNGTWNDVNYIGRSETFQIYSKFKRDVSFTLDIPCFNKTQLTEKHRALGQLASTTAGTYFNNVMGGVFLRVNVGSYLVDEYAILNNISYDIPDDSSWDIDTKLAMYLKVSISLTIIPNKRPEYEVGTPSSKTGFFGYLDNTTDGFLPIAYKKLYSSNANAADRAAERNQRNRANANQFVDRNGNFRTI
jgi:hypothetical protein